MRRWVIADLHFGHTNVIAYCNRPFSDADEMDKSLINKWNNVVSKDDIVYILGDFTLSRKKDYIESIVSKLNGYKVLVMGNHDNLKPKQYIELGFTTAMRRPIMIDPGVLLMHEPPEESIIVPEYKFIFGHVHNKPCFADDYSNCYCVSADRIDFTPIDLDKLIKSLKTNRRN